MSLSFAARPYRLRHLAWFGALVLLLRILGAELHHGAEAHEPLDSCELCLVLERSGQGLPAADVSVAGLGPVETVTVLARSPVATRRARSPQPRGPPPTAS